MSEIFVKCLAPWEDRSDELNRIFADAPENCTVKLEPGEYFLRKTIRIGGRKGLTIDGRGATFVLHCDRTQMAFDSTNPENPDGFIFTDCDDLTLRRFTFRQEEPSNTGGEVLNVTPEYVDVRFYAPIPENMQFNTGNAFSEDGHPLGYWWLHTVDAEGRHGVVGREVATTAVMPVNTPHKHLGNNCYRIWNEKDALEPNMSKFLYPGLRVCVKNWSYGPTAFAFRSCDRTLIEDVTIPNHGGFVFLILPRCRNLTFRRVEFQVLDRKVQPYSCVVDAIHTTGLGGKLLIEDCKFDGLGDDTLNAHTQTLRAKTVSGRKASLFFDKPQAKFPPRWGRTGDTLIVYDGSTLAEKGRVKITEIHDDTEIETERELLKTGDYVTNMAYMPEVILRRCHAVNSRSRFLVAATTKLEIADCCFDMTGVLPPVYISSAFRYWGEGGGAENVYIHDNEIRCMWDANRGDHPRRAIWVRVNDEHPETVQTRYRNIRIENNRIMGTVEVANTDGLVIRGNVFDRPENEAVHVHENCTFAE